MSLSPDPRDALGAVDVYWRPGCGYCDRLLRTLGDSVGGVRLQNMWVDDWAGLFVRRHNGGN
jgi:mycoredoxin